MNEITPTLGLRAAEAAIPENKLGIQIGEPVGHSRPPRVHLCFSEFPNAGITAVVTRIFEAGGISEGYEFPETVGPEWDQKAIAKAAEYTQSFLDEFNPDDGATLFLAGDEELADSVADNLDIPSNIVIKINKGNPEYIPNPTS